MSHNLHVFTHFISQPLTRVVRVVGSQTITRSYPSSPHLLSPVRVFTNFLSCCFQEVRARKEIYGYVAVRSAATAHFCCVYDFRSSSTE
ncbi:UDP-N-acetylglucosamine--N-acetylmuramyl-(pentapeptide) pyrophosphoryl-undecaprenol N-acetylglucosamine transferase [Clarias magur]|uniref:UDP-N-acetylglucosamine--N-acetylmuramyl-(Pentapeptide) pyrophosphoryl-undecaprenol N-acetylglucosamine transferase n=1 Tax=Clarias magur TaxID=1594786 RepID=A0A8J4X8S2_CLAMG|nr:UDP-N-acetylglucosamine--N-acetylmuramyl-(pentapeptide) pyrophosphoryl-undecaprenol N-acetylglucosamine transferase [Clarias magur]